MVLLNLYNKVSFIGKNIKYQRDLKPANILMSNGMVKIGDFGFAKKNVTQKLKNQTSVGTPLYMSAQLLKG